MSDCGCTSLHDPFSLSLSPSLRLRIFSYEIFVSSKSNGKLKYFFKAIGLLQPQDGKLRLDLCCKVIQTTIACWFSRRSFYPTNRSLARFPLPKRSENLKWKNHLLLKKLTSAENGKSINLKRAWWYSSPASFYSSRAITEMYANLIFMLQTTFAPVMLEHCQVKVRKAFRCSVQKERMETKHYSFILEEDKLEEHFKPKFHLPRYITLDRAVSW